MHFTVAVHPHSCKLFFQYSPRLSFPPHIQVYRLSRYSREDISAQIPSRGDFYFTNNSNYLIKQILLGPQLRQIPIQGVFSTFPALSRFSEKPQILCRIWLESGTFAIISVSWGRRPTPQRKVKLWLTTAWGLQLACRFELVANFLKPDFVF